jgi:hypothetical protein
MVVVALVWLHCVSSTPACGPFLGVQPSVTLRQSGADARFVVCGTLANAKLPEGEDKGSVELKIERVLMDHPFLAGKKVIEVPRYIPIEDPGKPPSYLIFFDIFRGKLDPYRSVKSPSDALLSYIKPLIAEPRRRDLLYFFRHLEDADLEVANDALMEFVQADYRDVVPLIKQMPAEQLARWLKSTKMPARVRLYATLLGNCGTEDHARMLRQMHSDTEGGNGGEGLLVGYTLLKPEAGVNLLYDILKNPKNSFAKRFDALRAVQFLHDFRPDRVKRKQMLEALCLTLNQDDCADIAVEALRQRNYSEPMKRVLALYREKSPPVMRWAVIRFALTFPKDPQAAEFLKRLRKEDPERVEDIEESLTIKKRQ